MDVKSLFMFVLERKCAKQTFFYILAKLQREKPDLGYILLFLTSDGNRGLNFSDTEWQLV